MIYDAEFGIGGLTIFAEVERVTWGYTCFANQPQKQMIIGILIKLFGRFTIIGSFRSMEGFQVGHLAKNHGYRTQEGRETDYAQEEPVAKLEPKRLELNMQYARSIFNNPFRKK